MILFKNNFWILPKKIIADFDICCINFSYLYLSLYNYNCNYFFSADEFISKNIKNKYFQYFTKNEKHLFIGYNSNEQQKTNNFLNIKNYEWFSSDSSGLYCIELFLKSKIYNEIHLIGMNFINESGAFVMQTSTFENINKIIKPLSSARRKKIYINSINTVRHLLKANNETKVYKTFNKSKLDFLPKSYLFYTTQKENITKNITKETTFKFIKID